MINKFTIVLLCLVLTLKVNAGNKIKVYFNHPVDTSVSTTINAVCLNPSLPDTIIAYINRAKYTIDFAIYNYTQGSYSRIDTAVNMAYARGVRIRWINDGTASSSGLTYVNPAINRLSSHTTGSYTIMHNKFVVIDAHSTNPNDATVISGSCNWTSQQFHTDYNNTIIIQDSALANAYTAEFNMMWGDTGLAPNTVLSKFGATKTDLGLHDFTIEGKHVELYFSPSDYTSDHIRSTIGTADKDLYFGMYSFTDDTDAHLIVAKSTSGVYVAGINDTASATYAPYTTFNTGLGANFKTYTGTGIFHNKYMIVDQADKCSDPIALTGSHNWSAVANTNNDENTLIIHDDTIANVYYQSFYANFLAFGGTLTTPAGCVTSASFVQNRLQDATIYPVPSTNGEFNTSFSLSKSQSVKIELYDLIGKKIATLLDQEDILPGDYNNSYTAPQPGMYLVRFTIGNEQFVKKVLVTGK